MDLVGAESRRGGTRGGRSQFSWEDVKPEERGYYLGNSTATALPPHARRRLDSTPLDWYALPPPTRSQAGPSSVLRATPSKRSLSQAGTIDKNTRSSSAGASRGFSRSGAAAKETTAPSSTRPVAKDLVSNSDDFDAVRRREKAMLDAALCGRSFSEAVRAALTESVASGGDDGPESAADVNDPHEIGLDVCDAVVSDEYGHGSNNSTKMNIVQSQQQKLEKQRRKDERARRREERRLRRARRRDSSESERESLRWRKHEEFDRRRRRRERESDREEENRRSTRRPRIDCDDDDSGDSDIAQHSSRRQRIR